MCYIFNGVKDDWHTDSYTIIDSGPIATCVNFSLTNAKYQLKCT